MAKLTGQCNVANAYLYAGCVSNYFRGLLAGTLCKCRVADTPGRKIVCDARCNIILLCGVSIGSSVRVVLYGLPSHRGITELVCATSCGWAHVHGPNLALVSYVGAGL